MSTTTASFDYIDFLGGVQPTTDGTNLESNHYTYSRGIRFENNRPKKIKGYSGIDFRDNELMEGVPRSIFSSEINGKVYQLIGTNSRLYAVIGGVLTNITPLEDSTIAAASSLSTNYNTLASNPIVTTSGSTTVRVNDTSASRYRIGDTITLSGSAAVGGISAANINGSRVIRSIGANFYTFFSPGTASSSATGGGAAVVRSSGLIRMTIANSLMDGDRVKVNASTDVGGVLAATINREHIIRNVSATFFDFMTTGTATSSVTSGGGASTTYQAPIAAGAVDESFGQGYGMGFYGVGLYGTTKISSQGRKYPRIWYFDRYGDYLIMTPGNGGKLYYWDGSLPIAPVKIPNSPDQINYAFVSDNIIVTFGNNGVENRVTSCDQNNFTVWTGTAENQVYDDSVEGAGRLVGHIPVQGLNLIATEGKVYTFRYIGLPFVWEVKKLADVGFISSQAGFEANGIAYWMDDFNFFQWRGGSVEIMPSNSKDQSTIRSYVYDNINFSQKSKIFSWYNKDNIEGSFHYPLEVSNEPNALACTNLKELSWWPDLLDRTAVEKPEINLTYPRMADVSGGYYQHNFGNDADGSPLTFTLTTSLRTLGKKEAKLAAFIPDSTQTGNITVSLNMQQWPQSVETINSGTYQITPTNGRQEVTLNGRFWNYTFSGSELGQVWSMGKWGEEKQMSGDGK